MQRRRWIKVLILFGVAIAIALGLAQVFPSEVGTAFYGAQAQSEIALGQREVSVPAFPENYSRQFVHYVTVDCPSNRSVRKMFVNRGALEALENGKPLPDGTTIAMETRSAEQQGDRLVPTHLNNVFVRQKQAGDWQNAWFSASGSLVSGEQATCIGCHQLVKDRDRTFTLPALKAAAQTGEKQTQVTEFKTSVCR